MKARAGSLVEEEKGDLPGGWPSDDGPRVQSWALTALEGSCG
jgi:hypothetical protein